MKNMRGRFRRFWSDMRLERKLLVSYILFAVIPILVIGTVICRVSFKIIMRQTRQYADMMIERINNDADAFVENIERQAYVVYTEPEIQDILEHADRYTFSQLQDGKEMIHKRLIGMWVTEKYIVGSYLCGAEGNSYYTNINERNDIDPAQVFSGESWYATITEGARKGVLTGVHRDDKYSDSSSLQLISYVHAVNSIGTGKYLGFLVIDIDARVLGEIVGNRAENLGGYITILDNENNVMYTTLPEETGRLGQVICMEHVSPGAGWTVRMEIPWSRFAKEIVNIMLLTAVVGALCFLVFIWLSRKISRSISAPIRDLQTAMARVEEGDMEVVVRADRDDEIGRLAGSFNHMVSNIKDLIEKVYLTQLGKKEAEFNALQSQINPHFMYNTLETVNMMAILDGSYEISDILTAFGKILRVNLDQKHNIIPLGRELEYIRNYLMIVQIRDPELFTFELNASPEAEKCLIPKLTLQPIVENSILHGFKEKMSRRRLTVNAAVERGRLVITVEDDGKGMTGEKLEYVRQSLELEESLGRSASIGLNNVSERCQLYFGESFSMEIHSRRGTGTRVALNAAAIYGEGEENDTSGHY